MASTSTSKGKKLTTEDKVIKEYGRALLRLEIAFELNEALQKTYVPLLKKELCYYKRLKGDLKKHGDYICYSILHVCEVLRSNDPHLFNKRRARDIATEIKNNFPKSDMIEKLQIHDVGFLTFKLNDAWMVKRICKNLKDGKVAWAPLPPAKKVIVDFSNGVLPICDRRRDISDVLIRMLEYCGVEVSGRMRNKKSLRKVKQDFPEEEGVGVIRSKKTSEALFIRKEKALHIAQPNNVHEDLASLWYGEYEQKAQWIICVTPVCEREYIMQCFSAAREFVDERHTTMSYLGYEPIGDEQKKNIFIWGNSDMRFRKSVPGFGANFGYDDREFRECILKYAYLKTLTYSCCTFDFEDFHDVEGNTFKHLLQKKKDLSNFLRNSRPNLESNKEFVGKDREVGLHLLQFTEIIQESILRKVPYLLCEYLYNLSNIADYILEAELSEIRVLLCKAVEVVMEISFDLLGIAPGSLEKDMLAIWGRDISLHASRYEPTSRFEMFSTSRFEMFSMSIEAPFGEGNLFGVITVSDTYGLRSDNWCSMDKKGCGQVAYFNHDWHDTVKFLDTSLLPFGDRVSGHSVPFSSSIKIDTRLWVTSKENDACYQLCFASEEIKLLDFWESKESVEQSTFSIQGTNGSLSIYYCLLKDAVDTKMSLEYVGHPRVSGRIVAYYGGGASHVGLHEYKALIFCTEPTNLAQGDLTLKKSMLAVPTDGSLVFDAHFKDVDTGKDIVKDKHVFHAERPGENSEWIIKGNNCSFILRVDWIRGRRDVPI